MPSWIKETVIHTVAVAVALGVALVLVKVLKVDSEVVAGVVALVFVALEKLVRANPAIPVGDYVNKQ